MLKDDVDLVYDFLRDEYGDSPFFPAMVRIKTALAESTNSSHNSAMDEIAERLSATKGATVSDQNIIDITVIKLRQLRQ
jgi:hypothetical protein